MVSLEGSAPVLPPKISVVQEHAPPVDASQMPNEFGAQKFVINHWLKPVAWWVF